MQQQLSGVEGCSAVACERRKPGLFCGCVQAGNGDCAFIKTLLAECLATGRACCKDLKAQHRMLHAKFYPSKKVTRLLHLRENLFCLFTYSEMEQRANISCK
jgi:hypothetical protein